MNIDNYIKIIKMRCQCDNELVSKSEIEKQEKIQKIILEENHLSEK